MLVSCSSVSKNFIKGSTQVRAVDNVSECFEKAEFAVIFGKSGSGKTTLLSLLAGITEVSKGTIVVAGHTITDMNDDERAAARRHDIGVIFQDHNLIEELTVLENTMLPRLASGVSRQQAQKDAEVALDQVGIGDLTARFPHEISGGQRQRTGIARALVGEKKVLLTDEPTGSLDQDNSRTIFGILKDLTGLGVCVISATHDPLATEYADRVLTMVDGRLYHAQPHELLTTNS